ncbi:MAG: XdhC family protein [Anaerolineaceae bacterium]
MRSLYQDVVALEGSGKAGALCTVIRASGSTPRHEGSKLLYYADGKMKGSVGGGEVENLVIKEAKAAIQDGKIRVLHYNMVDPSRGDPGICGGQLDIYIEPIIPNPTLLIVGGGHVGKALAHLAKWLGFRIAISDDRAEFCTPEFQPDGDIFLPISMSQITKEFDIDRFTYIVLTTRGSDVDVEGLPSLLEANPAYIGGIGSKRRWAVTKKQLLEKGISSEKLDEVHSPIGLELQAETPEEIAVSIMAEILMLRNGGTGKKMKEHLSEV